MRPLPDGFHLETAVCAVRGHAAPAAAVATIGPADSELGLDLDGDRRLSRCLRCDAWTRGPVPTGADVEAERLAPLAELHKPRRGHALKEAVLLRGIAVSRGLHCVFFALAAVAIFALEAKLGGLQRQAQRVQEALHPVAGTQGQIATRDGLSRGLDRLLGLKVGSLKVLLVTAIVYAVLEGVEAVGLWRERRWAEYLTAIALVGFLPFELRELADRVTVIRVGALVVNLAILGYLVWNKHLFGVNKRGRTAEQLDWDAILATDRPRPTA